MKNYFFGTLGIVLIGLTIGFASQAPQQVYGAPAAGANYIANTLRLPNLTSKNCLGTDSSGNVQNGTCSGGSSIGEAWSIVTNFFGQSSLAPTTTKNLVINGTGTSTFAGGVQVDREVSSPYFIATSSIATSTFAGYLQAPIMDKGGQVYDIRSYGAKVDGSTDDTSAVNSAIAAAITNGGGTIFFPKGTTRMNGAFAITYTNTAAAPTTLPVQPPLRFTGVGASWNGYWTGPSLPASGSIIDNRYTGADGIYPAKLTTIGAGVLEFDHIVFKDGGSDSLPFIYTTNTTLFVHHNAFSGVTCSAGPVCTQDAIILGGATSTQLQGSGWDNGFQGYGTKTSDNFYEKIRRAITWGYQANAVEVQNETISKTSGYSAADSAPFYFATSSSGSKIIGGTVEFTNYHYGITLNRSNSNYFSGIGFYDDLGTPITQVYAADTNSINNLFIQGFSDLNVFSGPGATNNTIIDGRNTTSTTSQMTFFPRGIKVGVGSGEAIDAPSVHGVTTLTSANYTTPLGTNMTIDTGTGGSFLDTKAYSNRFKDQAGNTKAEIQAGQSGGGAYFLGKVGIGTTTPYNALSVVGTTTAAVFEATTTATSTSNGGWNIQSGCFAIAGTCLTGSASLSGGTAGMLSAWTSSSALTSTSTPTATSFYASSTSATSIFMGKVSVGRTSASAALDIDQTSAGDVFITRNSGSQRFSINQSGGTDTAGSAGSNTALNGAELYFRIAGTEKARIGSTGLFGIGTTSPWRTLSVNGSSDLGINALAGSFTGTTTATSSLVGGLSTNLLSVLSTTASSTFANGINLTGGCFSINGTCLSTSGGGLSSYDAWTHPAALVSATTSEIDVAGFVSTASSTIVGNATTTGSHSSSYFQATGASATSTFAGGLAVESTGLVYDFSSNKVGVNTAAPAKMLTVGSGTGIQSSADGLAVVGAGLAFILKNTSVSNGEFNIGFNSNQLQLNLVNNIAPQSIALSAGGTARLTVDGLTTNVGVGTSTFATAAGRLTIASTTQPQLSLMGSDTDNKWNIRSIGNTLSFATSSPTSVSTSTVTALSINANGQLVNPYLKSCDTIDTDANGALSCGTDSGAAGGLSAYDAWTHPSAGVSATTSEMRFTSTTATTTIANALQLGGTAQDNMLTLVPGREYGSGAVNTTDGAININNTLNKAPGLQIYSNFGASPDAPLMLLRSDNTAFNDGVLRIIQKGTSGGAYSIRIDDPNPDIELYNTAQAGVAGDYEIAIPTAEDVIQIANSRKSDDSSFENIMKCSAWRLGGLCSIGMLTTTPVAKFTVVATGTSTIPVFDLSSSVSSLGDLMRVTNAGKVGIATSSPMSIFSTVGNEDHWGNYYHFGPSANPDTTYCNSSSQCLAIVGSDDSTLGVNLEVGNISTGIHAYSFVGLMNNRTDATGLHYAGLTLTGSNYSDTAFGTGLNSQNQLQVNNSDGAITVAASTSTTAGFFNVLTGGAATTNERMRILSTGLIGFGTSTPQWLLNPFSSTLPQLSLSAGAGISQWTMRNAGGNLYFATTTVAGTATSTLSTLSLINGGVAGLLGIGSSTPFAALSLGASSSIAVPETYLATSTSMTIDWRNGNTQNIKLGTAATTITFSSFIQGMNLKLVICNPNATAGAITWGTTILWSGGTVPTQTTTANKCDVWSFIATTATSTTNVARVFGSQSANF